MFVRHSVSNIFNDTLFRKQVWGKIELLKELQIHKNFVVEMKNALNSWNLQEANISDTIPKKVSDFNYNHFCTSFKKYFQKLLFIVSKVYLGGSV